MAQNKISISSTSYLIPNHYAWNEKFSFTNKLDFKQQNDNFFTTADSVLLAKDYGMLSAEEDVVFSQSTSFDFRILERSINVNFNLR